MARLLVIVPRTEPARYAYLKHVFARVGVEVIPDRRLGERRRCREPTTAERRRADRRVRDITKDLQTLGWALVRS